ncbi:hypothetical protein PS3A_05750 [Pseudomonas sp. 3A(2025)]
MADEFIKNGSFSEQFKDWGYVASFEPYLEGLSIRLPYAVMISQALPDLPGKTLRLKFDVRSLEEPGGYYAVTVGGYRADGSLLAAPVAGLATDQWTTVSGRLFFQEDLSNCFIQLGSPRLNPTDEQGTKKIATDIPEQPAIQTPGQTAPASDLLISGVSLTLDS